MFDTDALTTTIVAVAALVAVTIILRAIRAGDPVDLGSMFAHPWELDWPRGVQEEEPTPWRLERLRPDADTVHTVAIPVAPPHPAGDETWDAAA
jgi:hypothetical protein